MLVDFERDIKKIKSKIVDVPDFPSPGIVFKDISPLLADPESFKRACYLMSVKNDVPDYYAALDARGFLFATPMMYMIDNPRYGGVLMCRKKGKLPGDTISHSYQLEYGEDTIEMKKGIAKPGSKVIIVDDVLATGGTALAACKLCESLGLKVAGVTTLIELSKLGGHQLLESNGYRTESLIIY